MAESSGDVIGCGDVPWRVSTTGLWQAARASSKNNPMKAGRFMPAKVQKTTFILLKSLFKKMFQNPCVVSRFLVILQLKNQKNLQP